MNRSQEFTLEQYVNKPSGRKKALIGSTALMSALTFVGSLVPATSAEAAKSNQSVATAEKKSNKDERYQYLDWYNPEKDETLGNIRLARILPDEPYMTIKRYQGEKINVPYLRNNADPNLVAESALALYATYLTTGKQKPLVAFTTNPEITGILEGIRDDMSIEQSKNEMGGYMSQIVIYDRPEDPAVFSESVNEEGLRIISLESGTLFFHLIRGKASIPSEWQNEFTHKKQGEIVFNQLDFAFAEDANGQYSVEGVNIQSVVNPNK